MTYSPAPYIDLSVPCLEWTGRSTAGYGWLLTAEQEHGESYVHRDAWAKAFGPIPEGAHVLHACDNPPCYEWRHLFLGDHASNMRDMAAKGRHNSHLYPQLRQGEANGYHKLTNFQVLLIRSLEPYLSQRAIARRFGVSQVTVGYVQRKTRWAHV